LLSRWGLIRNQSKHSEEEDRSPPSASACSSEGSTHSHHAKRSRTNITTSHNPNINTANTPFDAAPTEESRIRLDKWYSAQYGAELDPVGFSFFLAANLPVSNEQLQRLLEVNTMVERLRLLICCNLFSYRTPGCSAALFTLLYSRCC